MTKEVAEPKVSQAPRRHSQQFKLGVVKRFEAGESFSSVCYAYSLSRGQAHNRLAQLIKSTISVSC